MDRRRRSARPLRDSPERRWQRRHPPARDQRQGEVGALPARGAGRRARPWRRSISTRPASSFTSRTAETATRAASLPSTRRRAPRRVLAENPKTDVGQVLIHPLTKTIEAVSFDYDRPTWKIVDASVEGDFYYLQTFGDGTLVVTSRSLDEQHWLVAYTHGDGPTHYYRYDRDRGHPRQPGEGDAPLHRRGRPGEGEARVREPRGHQGPRRARPRQLPHAAAGVGPAGRGPSRQSPADGPLGPRRTRGARLAGYDRRPAAPGQPRVRRSQRQLPWLDRVRVQVPRRRPPRVGRQDERRPGGRGPVGRRPEGRRPARVAIAGDGYGGYAA